MTALGRVLRSREMGLLAALLAVVGVIVLFGNSAAFFGRANQVNMLRQIGLLGVFAVGEAVVIIAGGIDLSVGSVIAFSGMLSAVTLTRLGAWAGSGGDLPLPLLLLGLLVALLIGVGAGLLHSLLITRLGLPPFIATMGTLAGLRSAAELVTRSVPIPCSYPSFRQFGNGLVPLWIFVVVALVVAVGMSQSRLGREIVALGGNEEAARLSGLPVGRLKLWAYVLSGLLAGLAGFLHAAYLGQGDPRAGVAYELQAVAATVVGGCSLNGGVGTIPGVVLGVVLLQVTLNGIFLVVQGNSTQWQGLVVGAVVVLAVAASNARQARQARVTAP